MAEEKNDENLRARLDSLSTSLDAQHKASNKRNADSDLSDEEGRSTSQAMNLGFRVLSEFVAAVLVGGLIGWKLDDWFNTAPLFLILFLAVGTAAGFWNIYRIAAKPPGSPGGLI